MGKNIPDIDPAQSYSYGITNTAEPELELPESTKEETDAKIRDEEKERKALDEAANVDIAGDGTNQTIVSGIPTYGRQGGPLVTYVESLFDKHLRDKRDRLSADLARLRQKYLTPVDNNIKKAQNDQKEIKFYDTLVNPSARSTRSYLQSVRSARRSKSSGKKGEYSSIQAAQTKRNRRTKRHNTAPEGNTSDAGGGSGSK